MGTPGHQSSRAAAARLIVTVTIATLSVMTGCVNTTTPAGESSVRQAVIDRWSRCIERQASAVPMNVDAQSTIEEGCEGHRRDVVHAFPPHLKRRLERTLDDREARLARTTFVKRVGDAKDDREQGFAESVSAD